MSVESRGRSIRVVRADRRDLLLRSLVAVLGALTAAVVAISAFETSELPVLQTAVLVALAMIAAHREAVFSDESAVSGSALVVCATVVGLGVSTPLAPLLVAAGAVLHKDHLRHLQLRKLMVNLGATVIPAFAATIAFHASIGSGIGRTALAAVGAVGIYWLLNSALVGLALALVQGQHPTVLILDLIKSDTVMLVFAVGGALCGLVMTEVAPWVGIVALAASLVALDVFVLSVPGGPAGLRSAWRMVLTRLAAGAAAGVVAAVVANAVAAPVVGAVTGLLAGLAVGLGGVSLVAAGRLLAAGSRVDARLLVGFSVGEIPLVLIAASAGVVGAEAGAAAGFVTASVLVALGSVVAARRRPSRPPAYADDDLLLAAVTEAILDGMPESLPQR